MDKHSLVIIGGGPAGMAAAIEARKSGIDDIVIYERDVQLGGILNQCIHNGFGLHTFKEELTGPEYAGRFIEQTEKLGIRFETGSMVLSVSRNKEITVVSRSAGLKTVKADAVILAMGCRERPRGALNIPGMRPQGVYTAGTAQKMVNCEGWVPGKEVVILGSGDIGLIMARRMTLEGAHVKVVAELMPYSGGLKRNIVQCLDDYDIPLKLSHTVVDIKGRRKLEGVTIAEVDNTGAPIPGTEEYYSCDTLLLSCGLIPENELSLGAGVSINSATNGPIVDDRLQTNVEGVFACGNVLHVHDLVDFVSEESGRAGRSAADYLKRGGKKENPEKCVTVTAGEGVRYTVPSTIDAANICDSVHLRFRVRNVYKGCSIVVAAGERELIRKKKKIMVPSEMEEVLLKKELLTDVDGITVTITGGGV